ALPVARPHDRLPRRVNPVREPHADVEVDARNRARERERHTVEGVVVVVQDDHAPSVARAGAGAAADSFARWREGCQVGVSKVVITASAITRSGRPDTWLALRNRANASASVSFSFSIRRPFARSITLRAASASE